MHYRNLSGVCRILRRNRGAQTAHTAGLYSNNETIRDAANFNILKYFFPSVKTIEFQ